MPNERGDANCNPIQPLSPGKARSNNAPVSQDTLHPDAGALIDAEVICSWMEPRPVGFGGLNRLAWWDDTGPEDAVLMWQPRKLTLDALREVQDRLTEEQWVAYLGNLLLGTYDDLTSTHKQLTHATPTQKIHALAAVLRPELEKK